MAQLRHRINKTKLSVVRALAGQEAEFGRDGLIRPTSDRENEKPDGNDSTMSERRVIDSLSPFGETVIRSPLRVTNP